MIGEYILLIFGVWACATAVIWIKMSAIHPVMLASLRLFVAAVALTPLFLRDRKRLHRSYGWKEFKATLLPGLILGLHFISWIYGARAAQSANASLIVNLVPVVMPFFLYFIMNEKLNRSELIATVLSLIGLVILGTSDFHASVKSFRGDVVCFGSMLLFAYYLVLSRKNSHFKSLWLYVVPLYYVAAGICFIPALFFDEAFANLTTGREIGLVLCLGLIPTVLGHSILNHAMKTLRGQVVSILIMGQFVFVGIMAYFAFHEVPSWTFYLASALLVASGVIATSQRQDRVAKTLQE